MQQESESREEIDGMQNCYQALLRIYQSKELYKQATVYAQKLIDLTLKYNLNKYNLTNKYLELSNCYLRTNESTKAWEALEESKLYIGNELNQGAYLCGLLRYYIHTKDMVKARETLKETKQLFSKNTELRIKRTTNLLEIETNYYMETGEYEKALDAFQQAFEKLSQNGFITPTLYRTRGSIYTAKKDYQKAIESYEKAFQLSDSLSSAQEDISVGEFATILGMEHLNLENKELIQKNQEIQLEKRRYLIILLCIIVVIVGVMFFRETRLNKVLRRAKDAEQSASRMKTEFIQNMSHEIRTPLNSIVGFSQILSSKISEEDEESKEYTGIIEQGSNHLLQLVDNVLELANLDSGTPIPTDTKVEINALCRQWVEKAKNSLKPGVELVYQPEQDELHLYTNPGRLTQVVSHLLHNSARFTEKGSITLSWHINPKQRSLVISVTDTGIGIPQDKQDFVFERFAKIDTFSTGTGLGLALGRLIMEKMNGSLMLDDKYTEGCRFVLTLPIK
ncbi:tetratricopeptide repeat-containing sensor histidine kinase [Bacteroides sp.]